MRLLKWKTQLKAEKSIRKIYQRDFNAAWRKLSKNMEMIKQLEDKIATHLAKTKQWCWSDCISVTPRSERHESVSNFYRRPSNHEMD